MNQTVKFPLIDTIIRIVVLFLLIAWCIGIILPFLEPVIWGAIIAIVLHPFFAMVKRWVGNRNMLAAVMVTLLILVILLLPTALLVKSMLKPSKQSKPLIISPVSRLITSSLISTVQSCRLRFMRN